MFYLKRLSNSNFKCISFQYIRAVTSNLVIIVILCNNLLSHFVTPVTLSNKFRLTCHPLQWFLSQFPIIFLKFVNLSPFVTLCDKFFQKGQKSLSEVFWSLFVIKTVIAKNWDSVHIFTSQKRYSKTFLLFLSLWIFRLCKAREIHQYFKNQSEQNFPFGHFSTLLGQIKSKKPKLSL